MLAFELTVPQLGVDNGGNLWPALITRTALRSAVPHVPLDQLRSKPLQDYITIYLSTVLLVAIRLYSMWGYYD